MSVPPQVSQWLAQTYPKPKIDPDWLFECYDYIVKTHHLNPGHDLDQILQHIDVQLLESSLSDSTLHYTGIPRNIGTARKGTIGVPPVLVQITSITEIGHSAFSLQTTRQTRIDRADLAGLAEEDGGEDDGPIPRYPRSMLQFRISDGTTEIDAIEYRKIPELELGETPLGFKLLLKGVKVRRGIAFLEPGNVILKGHRESQLENDRERTFLLNLHTRTRPDEPFVEPANMNAERQALEQEQQAAPALPPAPGPIAPQAVVPPPRQPVPPPRLAAPTASARPKSPPAAPRPPVTTSAPAGPSHPPDTQRTLVDSSYVASNKPTPAPASTRATTVVDAEDPDTEMEDPPNPPGPSSSDYFYDEPDEEMLAWADELETQALSQQPQKPASQGASQPTSQTQPGSQGQRAVGRTVTELFSSQGSRAEEDGRQSPPKKRIKVSTGRRAKPQSNGPPVRTITQLFGASQASQPSRDAPIQDDSDGEVQPKQELPRTQAQIFSQSQSQAQTQTPTQVAGPSARIPDATSTQRRTKTPPALAQPKAARLGFTQTATSTQAGRAPSAGTTTQVHDVIEIDTDTEDEDSAPPSSQAPPGSQWERYRRVVPGVGSILDLT